MTRAPLDGSGYVATFTNNSGTITASLKDINGKTIIAPINGPGAGSITDTNGNQVSVSSNGATISDPFGTAITITHPRGTEDDYTYTGGNGSDVVKVYYSSITINTSFGCGDIEYTVANSSNTRPDPVNLPTQILYPDGSKYLFAYDGDGRITKVTLRTGGVIEYSYGTSVNCTDGTTNNLSRSVSLDGVNLNTTSYTRAGNAPATSQTAIKDPSGNNTVVSFAYYQEILRSVYTGAVSGTPIEQITHCYNFSSAAPCNTATGPGSQNSAGSAPKAVSVLRVFNGSTSNDNNVTYYGQTYTDGTYTYLLPVPTEVDTYGFGSTTAMRRVVTPVGSWTGSSCATIGSNILNRTCYRNVYDSGSGLYSSTTFSYDTHGNTTAMGRNTGSLWLTTQYFYDTNGTVSKIVDPNGSYTTFTNKTCGASPYLLPKTIQTYNSAGTLLSYPSYSLSYDSGCHSDKPFTVTDANGVKATYTYNDPFWRTTRVDSPWQNGSTTPIYTSHISPVETETYQYSNGSGAVEAEYTNLDALGRVFNQQKADLGGQYDTVSYSYDANGRLSFVSSPCLAAGSATATCPYGKSYSSYDGLGRAGTVTDGSGGTVTYTYKYNDVNLDLGGGSSQVFSKQLEYDALGRLTSVCERSGTFSDRQACGQSVAQTGYLSTYGYDPAGRLTSVSQSSATASQGRTFQYDLVGRLTSEANPENGTTYYYYETACGGWGASNGDLNKRVDANNNVTCFIYDSLHRLTDAAGWTTTWRGPCRRFRYDASSNGVISPGTGWTLGDEHGHLVEAETDDCSKWPPTPITDEWFGYADNSQRADLYESTPHSGGYYHIAAQYWENGIMSQLNGSGVAFPTLPVLTYGLDGVARVNTVSAMTGQNPVTSTSYNAAGQVTGITFGSADSDTYTFDAGTGRMKDYAYTVNGQTDAGTLTWNANGTLGTLGITDPFNSSGDTQTCTYGYDDIKRLSSVSCGSLWAQTFTYDLFGNITKSGSISFMPGYSSATNRYTSLPSLQYDSDGNPLNDSFHQYTWDANWNNVSSIDATGSNPINLTFDALDRMVEQDIAGTYYQIFYGPDGKKLAVLKGQTLQQGFVPLPGNTTAEYLSWGLSHYRHPDWLGSDRLASGYAHAIVTDNAYAPFGEPYSQIGNGELSFAGANKDTVWLNYDFLGREYAPHQGRFISPDPAGLSAVSLGNPQTWNRYAYVANAPLENVDPDGLNPWAGQGCAWGNLAGTGSCGGVSWDEFDLLQLAFSYSVVPGGQGTTRWYGASEYPNGGDNPNPNIPTPDDPNINSGNSTIYPTEIQEYNSLTAMHVVFDFGLPSPEVLNATRVMPILRADPINFKKEFCDQQSNLAAADAVLPGLGHALNGNYQPLAATAATTAATQAATTAASTYSALYTFRSLTGIPMSITSKFITAFGVVGGVITGYKSYKAMHDTYQTCMR